MDIAYVVAMQNKNGILDRQAKELQKVNGGKILYKPNMAGNPPFILPKADLYVATHYALVEHLLLQNKPVITLFTHESYKIDSNILNKCKYVIAENDEGANVLELRGVKREIIRIIAECGDNETFKPHDRKQDGSVLICGRNYETGRKNPKIVNAVIGLMPHRKFIILGKEWERDIEARPNVTIIDPDYSKYPEIYSKCSVYLSCSHLEGGGPNSLIESMHSNMIPVSSITGNARDYICHGFNGYLFPSDSKPEYIASLIDKAFNLDPKQNFPFKDVWETVTEYNWTAYAKQWSEYLE